MMTIETSVGHALEDVSPCGDHPTAQSPRGGGPGAGQEPHCLSEAEPGPAVDLSAVEAELR